MKPPGASTSKQQSNNIEFIRPMEPGQQPRNLSSSDNDDSNTSGKSSEPSLSHGLPRPHRVNPYAGQQTS